MTTSKSGAKPVFVYLQRPDNGEWITIGRYLEGGFVYAPSYFDLKLPTRWSIDPVNLPLIPGLEFRAPRYEGLHDVLRDAAPDAWGRALIRREHRIRDDAPQIEYLLKASNADRWGALAVGFSKSPAIAHLAHPEMSQLEDLVRELLAMQTQQRAIFPTLRRRLMTTPSLGGARPKAIVQDGQDYWLVKPILPSDTCDIPALEHACQRWGAAAGLNFAQSAYTPAGDGSPISIFRSLRFDRQGPRRFMTISAAAILQTEYPGNVGNAEWCYSELAARMSSMGVAAEDNRELFGRMIFNAVIGNDDDHPRNHALRYRDEDKRWTLAPAYDVVPNPDFTPDRLAMRMSKGNTAIDREATLSDWNKFGFDSRDEAESFLDAMLARIHNRFHGAAALMDTPLRDMMASRLTENLARLQA